MKARLLRQSGAALAIGLIMLILMTLLAVVSIELGRGSFAVAGNLQFRSEAYAAANSAIEDAVSTARLTQAPDAIYLEPCAGANTKCVDANGDGTDDIIVALTPSPRCIQALVLRNNQLNIRNAAERACIISTQQGLGIEGTNSGDSLCASSMWEFSAVATDRVTQAQVRVTSGAAVRVPSETVATSCI